MEDLFDIAPGSQSLMRMTRQSREANPSPLSKGKSQDNRGRNYLLSAQSR